MQNNNSHWTKITALFVGDAYINEAGDLEVITKTWMGTGRLAADRFFGSRSGRHYDDRGNSLTGDPHRRLVDKAQEMILGATYELTSGTTDKDFTASYVVTELCQGVYKVHYNNGADNQISYGSPANRESVLISRPEEEAVADSDDEEEYRFNNGLMIMKREYGDVVLPQNDGVSIPADGQWIVRLVDTGEVIDRGKYRDDLIDRYDVKVTHHEPNSHPTVEEPVYLIDHPMFGGSDPAGERLSGDDGYQV